MLKYFGIPFEEVLIPLYESGAKEEILKYSHAGKVPVLISDGFIIWESLAICEYLSDIFPQKNLWPKDVKDRALAHAISHEMHAGFSNLRTNMPMNVRKKMSGFGRKPEVEKDIQRIRDIWKACRSQSKTKGDFLFGPFTIADAMYAPVVFRFHTYEVTLSGIEKDYFDTMLNLPAMKEWAQSAVQEPHSIAEVEAQYAKK